MPAVLASASQENDTCFPRGVRPTANAVWGGGRVARKRAAGPTAYLVTQ
jgi:hypothetical protein